MMMDTIMATPTGGGNNTAPPNEIFSKELFIQDRRGFEPLLRFGIVLMAVGSVLVCIGIPYFCVGIFTFIFGAIVWYTTYKVSQPPSNNPVAFVQFLKENKPKHPVLVCVGDSLTHGKCSANIVDSIRSDLSPKTLEPSETKTENNQFQHPQFQHPLAVINAAQNNICSWTVLAERIYPILNACRPNFCLIWIGTNDVRCMYKTWWGKQMVNMWNLPYIPSLHTLEFNFNMMISRILFHALENTRLKHVGICTLPPMGEDLSHQANVLVRKVNVMIEKTVAKTQSTKDLKVKFTLIPVYKALEHRINSSPTTRRSKLPVDYFLLVSPLMSALYYVCAVLWKTSSRWIGNEVLSDSLHLNEVGRDVVLQLVVEWLEDIK